jgi:hypothetical protein
MTNKQRQHLLAYLGYYKMDVDGDWGSGSREACREFQRDRNLTVDGYGGPETDKALRYAVYNDLTKTEPEDEVVISKTETTTGTFWDNSEFFDREEFRCQCKGKYCNGFPVEPEEELVLVCNEIRRRLGVPVSIVDSGGSGVRCLEHNAAVGGVRNSNHLYGKAADLHSKKSPQEMASVAESVMGATGEIGIYSWGIHIAVDCEYSRFYG